MKRINTKQAAKLTGRHPETIREAIRDGRITSARKAGVAWMMDAQELRELFPDSRSEAERQSPDPSTAPPAPMFVAFIPCECSASGKHHWLEFQGREDLEAWLSEVLGRLRADLEFSDAQSVLDGLRTEDEIRENRPPPSIVRDSVRAVFEKLWPEKAQTSP